MDKDGVFQPLKEDVDFMSSPFLGGPIGGLGLPTKDESSTSFSGSLTSTSLDPSVADLPAAVSPSSEHLDGSLQSASLVHSKDDEYMSGSSDGLFFPSMPMDWTLSTQNGPFHGLPYHLDYPFEKAPLGTVPHQYFMMNPEMGFPSPEPLPPWRSAQHESISSEYPPTLSPSQLDCAAPPPTPSGSSDGSPHDRITPLNDQGERTEAHIDDSTYSTYHLPATSSGDGDSNLMGISGNEAYHEPQRRPARKGLPDGRYPSSTSKNKKRTVNTLPSVLYRQEDRSNHHLQRIVHPRNVLGSSRITKPGRTASSSVSSSAPRRITPIPANSSERAARDEFLLECRAAGMSYRQLKEYGNLPEAESTLRGRYRTLTKHKTERVRRPLWTDRDKVELLCEAVDREAWVTNKGTFKICWTNVAMDVEDNGGSYPFGVTACRKKWDEISDE